MNEAKEKELILEHIEALASRQAISKEEIEVAYYKGIKERLAAERSGQAGIVEKNQALNLTTILYYIGGAVICAGIAILVRENWTVLSMAEKIAVSLGSAILAYILGVAFGRYDRSAGVASAFYLIFALVAPVGLAVTFNAAGYYFNMPEVQSLISALLFCVCLISSFAVRPKDRPSATLFSLFSIFFGTWLFFAFTNFLNGSPFMSPVPWSSQDFFLYRLVGPGLVYCLLGYAFSTGRDNLFDTPPFISEFLYGAGSVMFLGSAMALGGWIPYNKPLWEIFFPLFVFGAFFTSVYVKSKSLLVFASIFLMAYILKITAEYFSQNIGWPTSLVIAGLLIMIVGWLSFHIHKKYML